MSCVLQVPPSYRTPATDPGRIVKIYRGGSCVWYGQLNEPVMSTDGQQLAAHGAGTFGSQFAAYYPGSSWDLNTPVNQAIGRGLAWINPGIAGGWLAQQPDSASITVTDHLNGLSVPSAQVWQVDRWNTLRVGPIPSTVTRLLVSTDPVTRTIASDITTVWLKYTASDDGMGNTTYGLTDSFSQLDINQHGPTEVYSDLSNAGVLTAGSAQAVGTDILARYQRAAFAGPFTVRFGQYLTTGGTPVDLGCERAGEVARLLVSDAPFGGEQVTGLIEFVVGGFQYDDDSATAQVTPMQSARSDFSSLLSLIVPGS